MGCCYGQPGHSTFDASYQLAVRRFFSPAGRYLITGGGGPATVWDLETGTLLQSLGDQFGDQVRFAAPGPGYNNGGSGFYGLSGDQVQLFDPASGEVNGFHRTETWHGDWRTRKIAPVEEGVTSFTFSPDGNWLMAPGTVLTRRELDGAGKMAFENPPRDVRIWNVFGNISPVTRPLEHPGGVTSASFGPDGRTVVTSCTDKCFRTWTLRAHLSDRPFFVTFSRDSERAALPDSTQIWDLRTGRPVSPPSIESASRSYLSPDGRKLLPMTQTTYGPIGMTTAVAGPHGRRILLGRLTGPIEPARVRDAAGKPLTSAMDLGTIKSLSFNADGSQFVTAASDGNSRVWDATTGKPVTPVLDPPQLLGKSMMRGPYLNNAEPVVMVNAASFSPDGLRVVTAQSDSAARQWDARTGQLIGPELEHANEVTTATYSPDGLRIVTSSKDGTARVWDSRTGQPVSQPMVHKDEVSSAAFSPDGLRVVTASRDETARVWDAATGQPMTSSIVHSSPVESASFTTDGRRIITRCVSLTEGHGPPECELWDAATGQPLTGPLSGVAITPDGRWSVRFENGSLVRTSLTPDEDEPPALVELRAEVWTGLSLDKDGVVTPLDPAAFRERQSRLATEEARHAASCKYREANFYLQQQKARKPVAHHAFIERHVNWGREFFTSGNYQEAYKHFTRAIEIQGDNKSAYHYRAWANLYLRQGRWAAADATQCLKLDNWQSDQAFYYALVAYFGYWEAGQDQDAAHLLQQATAKLDLKKWPGPVIRYLSGELSEANLLALATDNDKLTEAHAYVGMQLLLSDRGEQGITHLKWVRDTGNKAFFEHHLAVAELERLKR